VKGAKREVPGLAAGDESGAALPSCDRYIILGIFCYSYLSYKAESAGTLLIKVDPRDTSQMCSNCGSIVKKTLSKRVHDLPTLRVCCRWRLQCCGEYSPRGDGTALRACGARTSASHLCGASAGHEAGSPALEARGSSRMNADDNLDVENEAC
jgi:hypothetical protein